MLDNGEYSDWVKTIFLGVKADALVRSFRMINSLTRWITMHVLLNNRTVAMKQLEHWNYSAERVNRRLGRTADRPDLWTKILEKREGDGGLTLGEHESNASIFMVAGTEVG